MCPTVVGRLETRTAILVLPAIIAAILSAVTQQPGYIVALGLYYILGVTLDLAVYPLLFRWQPPWLTFVLGFTEFILLFVLLKVTKAGSPGFAEGNAAVGLSDLRPIIFYWAVWTLAIWTKVVVLPIISLTWIEDGGEFRRATWSHPPEYQSLPVIASVTPAAQSHLAREFASGPAPAQWQPGLTGAHARPPLPG